ncbi:type II toxin-antitoxin system HipA family toxin [Cellulomonas cellasea]|uniref:type II toxin-antitoxin system HipA family toxin n=1 Tax=Cellulomonas cellasea TaxID=43670 RepID=UPI0025A43E87|nr:type II toxin-antitoxin system HipA family toxin [Cellulomonas cellasea]MDM8085205.1 type II toxin-antitoxin system HipA family toxin [Cellulomonas cellasea]
MRLAFALYGQVAGVIDRDGERTRLEYLPEYRIHENPTPLSLSMPVSATPYSGRAVEAYLRGLLPDHAEVRQRWARKAGVRTGNTLGLIAHVGLDVPGGAVFTSEDAIDDAINRPGELTPASDAAIADKLRRIRHDDAAWQDDDDAHWSLAGAQSKFTLARTPDGWAFADGSAPSTHIVKPGIGRIRAQALSEHVSMRALALVGLEIAETHYLAFEDQDAIVVTRFDRRTAASGATIRIHQEDVVQAHGMDPSRKYESDGGPGAQRIADLLRTAADAASIERFARAVIANQILGAPDAHGKNYGLLLIGGSATLAPLYDVATGLIPDAAGRLRYPKGAMSIGGERRFGDVELGNWEKFARALGLPVAQVVDWVDDLATTIPPAFAQAAEETDSPDADFLAGAVATNIAAVAQQTREGLASTRRSGGRVVTPFIETLPGQGRAGRRAHKQAAAAPAEPNAELTQDASIQDDRWGA